MDEITPLEYAATQDAARILIFSLPEGAMLTAHRAAGTKNATVIVRLANGETETYEAQS